MTSNHYALYRFDRIAWNGYAQYVSEDPEEARVYNMRRVHWDMMGCPKRIMVLVVPMDEEETENAVQQGSTQGTSGVQEALRETLEEGLLREGNEIR